MSRSRRADTLAGQRGEIKIGVRQKTAEVITFQNIVNLSNFI
jgi:hypothetical protein